MRNEANVRVVQSVYESFGRGDVPAILDHLSEDVVWIHVGAPKVPYGRTYRGPQDVANFFKDLDTAVQFTAFEPKDFISEGDVVVALGSYKSQGRATGKSSDGDWAMVWHFKEGKVFHYQAYIDTLAVAESLS